MFSLHFNVIGKILFGLTSILVIAIIICAILGHTQNNSDFFGVAVMLAPFLVLFISIAAISRTRRGSEIKPVINHEEQLIVDNANTLSDFDKYIALLRKKGWTEEAIQLQLNRMIHETQAVTSVILNGN